MTCNGRYDVNLKTIHGHFIFPLQRYEIKNETYNYFDLSHQFLSDHLSPALRELVGYYSNRLSYEELEKLVERVTGEGIVSDQKSWKIVTDKAVAISSELEDEIELINSRINSEVKIASEVDIYNSESEEILLFDDGICVREQKEERKKKKEKTSQTTSCPTSEADSQNKKSRKMLVSDVVLLEISKGKFKYIISPIDPEGNFLFPIDVSIKTQLKLHYQNYAAPLPIVAIVDGASTIRKHLKNLNEAGITTILDWYHLCKKVREFLAMISYNKNQKSEHLKFLFSHLWRGKVEECLTYLTTKIEARNPQKLDELIKYFTKHKQSIINYELRKQAKKTIGSGRIEKGVDLTIGKRQKNKGMSWRKLGSRGLAILKVTEFNGKWQQAWFPEAA